VEEEVHIVPPARLISFPEKSSSKSNCFFFSPDERHGLCRPHERCEYGHALLAALSHPTLGIDESGDDGRGDGLQVKLVAGEGEEGKDDNVQDGLAHHGALVANVVEHLVQDEAGPGGKHELLDGAVVLYADDDLLVAGVAQKRVAQRPQVRFGAGIHALGQDAVDFKGQKIHLKILRGYTRLTTWAMQCQI
jgi:hypothetical protein